MEYLDNKKEASPSAPHLSGKQTFENASSNKNIAPTKENVKSGTSNSSFSMPEKTQKAIDTIGVITDPKLYRAAICSFCCK